MDTQLSMNIIINKLSWSVQESTRAAVRIYGIVIHNPHPNN
jgi:hypothetical protein